ncbi:heavy-metal-associated domain-containing protein [Clostridium baratii]|uniref:heavy-metal-associated domain-containing protein n=1 Tax=Clostridium baratii TaxID=1561 RepID=UPI00097FB0FD|nr:heavy metal-associated domain-containing protein [Clostridium baratii]AQM59394.1 heavy metal-binding protein [Clostridium baratii]
MTKYNVKIGGMGCAHCIGHIQEALEDCVEVKDFTVELGSAVVEGDVSEAKLKDIIEDAGYDVESITKA